MVPLEQWVDFNMAITSMDVPNGFFPLYEGGIMSTSAGRDALPFAMLYTGDDLNEGKQYVEDVIVPLLGDDTEYDVDVLSWYNWTVESGNFEGKCCCLFVERFYSSSSSYLLTFLVFLRQLCPSLDWLFARGKQYERGMDRDSKYSRANTQSNSTIFNGGY